MSKDLSLKQIIIMGGGLFSMHFGAGCMLYPVTWGRESGNAVFVAYLGVFITGLLLPLLGYVALSRGEGTFLSLCKRFSPRFGTIFCSVTAAILGPLYIIPRMSAASWDAILQLTGYMPQSLISIIFFNVIFYATSYWFVFNKSNTVKRIGQLLFPILITIVIGVFIKGLLTPISNVWVAPSYNQSPIIYGFLQGYATGDLQCALLFGMVIVQSLKSSNIPPERVNNNLLKIGIVGIGILAFAHLGHMLIGASTGGTIDLGLSALYTEIVILLWGKIGGVIFNIALMTAALTCAIGLTASSAEYFEEVFQGRFSYNTICIITSIISAILGSIGLNNIVRLMSPLLDACYPGAIIIVLYYVFMPDFNNPQRLYALKYSVIAATVMGMYTALYTYNNLLGINNVFFASLYKSFFLAEYHLTWIPVSILFYILGDFRARKKKHSSLITNN